jgi:hypothetical protein
MGFFGKRTMLGATMPKTPVNKNSYPRGWESYVYGPSNSTDWTRMQSEP